MLHPSLLARCLLGTLLVAMALATGAQDPQDPPARSPRNASYEIDASLDAETKTITGRQTVRWRNIQDTPTDELWFHLWWNAWRNDHSTWMREDRIRGRSSRGKRVRDDDWSWQQIDSIRLGDVDLLPTLRFDSSDHGNTHDRTVFVVTLPTAVEPGETVEVELAWRAKIPRTFARTGFWGDYFFIAHWVPQLGVYEPDGWNCHHFHAATEFYADYGVWDVTLTVPDDMIVGATGRSVPPGGAPPPQGMAKHRFVQEDVHGFTWTASADFEVVEDRFEAEGLPGVDLRLLIFPENRHQAERHLHATKVTLDRYGRWYGPYPYRQLTVVDPAFGSGTGGMEYPTLFTSGTRRHNPMGGGSPEGVTVHEAGHQFWYGVVGNNEIEFAWLDEGLNTFSTARVMDEVYGPSSYRASYLNPPGTRRLRGFFRVLFDDAKLSRTVYGNRLSRYIRSDGPTMDPMSRPTYQAYPAGAGSLSYHKTAMWLSTLERYLGWDTLQRAMATFYSRWSFAHPEPEDFFAVLEEVSGQDLSWFFDQVYYGTVQFDYAVARASSRPAALRGFAEGEDGDVALQKPDDEDTGESTLYRTEVVVRRHGGGVFPVELLMTFEDGSEVRRGWDGSERWRLFVEERPSKLAHVVIDPDRTLILDLDYTNNSHKREAKGAARFAARKWSAKWMVWLQDVLTTFTFYL